MSVNNRWGIFDDINVQSYTLDSASKKVAARLLFARAAVPQSVTIYVASVTGTAPTFALRIETDNGSGNPSGSLYDANAVGTFTPTGAGYYTVSFGTLPGALTANTIYHLVVQHSSGTIDGSNKAAIAYIDDAPWDAVSSFVFQRYDGAIWSTVTVVDQMVCAVSYTSGAVQANTASANVQISVWGSIRAGQRFQLPIQVELTAIGARVKKVGSPSDLVMALLDSAGTVVASVQVPAARITTAALARYEWYFSQVVTLSANQTYRAVVRTATGGEGSSSDSYTLQAIEFGNAAWSFDDANAYLTQGNADAGPWTDSLTQDALVWLVFENVAQTTTLNTVDDVLDEGNWQVDAWKPRVADDSEFRTFVQSLLTRANNYVKWRVGQSYYAAQAGSVNENIFREAEMQMVQFLLCRSAGKIADTSDHPQSAPWLKEGAKLHQLAAWHKEMVEELLGPFDTIKGRPGRVGPYFRGVTTTGALVEPFDPSAGTDGNPFDDTSPR